MNRDCRVSHGAARVAQATHTSVRRGGKLGSTALCRRLHRPVAEVRRIRGKPVQALVRSDAVVEVEVGHPSRIANEKAHPSSGWAFSLGAPGGDLLSRGQSALSSAQSRFTVLFGMGRRGSNSLWPPSKRVGGRPCWSTPRIGWACRFNNLEEVRLGFRLGNTNTVVPWRRAQGYRIKSHGQLVSVSSTCCHASTPDLSTRWSSATL